MARVSAIYPHQLRFRETLRDLRHARAEFGVTETRIQELSTAVEHAFRAAMEAMKEQRNDALGNLRVCEEHCAIAERRAAAMLDDVVAWLEAKREESSGTFYISETSCARVGMCDEAIAAFRAGSHEGAVMRAAARKGGAT